MRQMRRVLIIGCWTKSMVYALLDEGYDVVWEEESGGGFSRIMDDDLLDAIIIDEGMPPVDGIELLPALSRFHESPILIVVGSGQEGALVWALNKGADAYVKPQDIEELLARLHNLFLLRAPVR